MATDELEEPRTEVLPDGDIAVGEPEEEEERRERSDPDDFYANLMNDFDSNELHLLGSKVIEDFDADEESRAEWIEAYQKGLEATKAEQPTDATEDENSGLAQVVHPLIMKAATGYQSNAIAELYPPGGPVSTIIKGEVNDELEQQGERVQGYMNYQITEEMTEYFDDLDQMLLHKALVGHIFRKTWWDPILERPTIQYVLAEDIVVDYTATNLATANRISHILRYNKNDFDTLVERGFYDMDGEPPKPPADESTLSRSEKVEGKRETTEADDPRIILIEQHRYIDFEPDAAEGAEARTLPYVVTVEKSTMRVVSIRRGWRMKDDQKRRRHHGLSSWKFFPGLGFYGHGLYHVIGGLGHAATDVLRAILDASAFSTMRAGFMLRGPNASKTYRLVPGELTPIESTSDDINKSVKMIEYAEPGQTLFLLLGALVEQGEKFAAVSGLMVGEGNNAAPVGTTLAMIENGSRVFAGIHIRAHQSQKQDFRNLADLNAEYIPEEGYPYRVKGADRKIFARDFDDRIDIIPVSDPRIFSSTQRISMAQASWQLAQQAPEFHDKIEVLKNLYQALRVPNYESWLIEPVEAVPLDPVSENVALMGGKPIKAYIYQNHQAHIMVLDQWFGSLPPQAQQMLMSQYIAHRAEHMSMLYFVQVQSAMAGAPLPAYPDDIKDPKAQLAPVDARTDAMISQAAAMMSNKLPPQLGPPLPQPGGAQGGAAVDPAQAIIMAAKAEAEATMMKTQAEIQAKQKQNEAELQMRMIEFRQELKMEREKAEFETWKITMKTNAEIAAKKIKADADAAAAATKTAHEIRRDEANTAAERHADAVDREHERQVSNIERAQSKQEEAVDNARRRQEEDIDRTRAMQQEDMAQHRTMMREDVAHQTATSREDEIERTRADREDELERKAAKREDELAKKKGDKDGKR